MRSARSTAIPARSTCTMPSTRREVRSLDSLMRLLIQRLQRAEEKRYRLTPYSNDNLLFSSLQLLRHNKIT